MKRSIVLSLLIFFSFTNTSFALDCGNVKSKKPMNIEEIYKAMCFEKMDTAIKKFEEKTKSNLSLPEKIPFKAKYKFGKFDEKLDLLKLNFVKDHKNIFKIQINTEPFNEPYNYTLKNGTKAFIRDSPDKEKSIISLTFKRDKYQYILYGFKSNHVKKETFIEIAESIQ